MAKRPQFKAPPIGKKKKKRTSYSVSKDIYKEHPKGGLSQSVKPKKSVTIGAKVATPRGGSVGISRNPHSKGITFTSRIGEESYIDVSTDDQGTFNLGFRKNYKKGGKFKNGGKFRNFVRKNY